MEPIRNYFRVFIFIVRKEWSVHHFQKIKGRVKTFEGGCGGFWIELIISKITIPPPSRVIDLDQGPGVLSVTFAKNGRVIFKESDVDGAVTLNPARDAPFLV